MYDDRERRGLKRHAIDIWQPLASATGAFLYPTEIGEQVGRSSVSVLSRAQFGAEFQYSPLVGCPAAVAAVARRVNKLSLANVRSRRIRQRKETIVSFLTTHEADAKSEDKVTTSRPE